MQNIKIIQINIQFLMQGDCFLVLQKIFHWQSTSCKNFNKLNTQTFRIRRTLSLSTAHWFSLSFSRSSSAAPWTPRTCLWTESLQGGWRESLGTSRQRSGPSSRKCADHSTSTCCSTSSASRPRRSCFAGSGTTVRSCAQGFGSGCEASPSPRSKLCRPTSASRTVRRLWPRCSLSRTTRLRRVPARLSAPSWPSTYREPNGSGFQTRRKMGRLARRRDDVALRQRAQRLRGALGREAIPSE